MCFLISRLFHIILFFKYYFKEYIFYKHKTFKEHWFYYNITHSMAFGCHQQNLAIKKSAYSLRLSYFYKRKLQFWFNIKLLLKYVLCISYFNRRKLCSCCYYYYYGVANTIIIEMQIHKQTKFFPISYSIQYLYYQIIHLQDIFQGFILTTEFNFVAHGCSGFFIGGKLKSNMRYKDAFIDMERNAYQVQ